MLSDQVTWVFRYGTVVEGRKDLSGDLGNNRRLKVSFPMKGEIRHEFCEYDYRIRATGG